MLSRKLSCLSEQVLGEDRFPADMRADLAAELADLAELAARMEARPVPRLAREVPAGCIDLAVVREMRRRLGKAS